MHQMGLAQSDPAIEEERVESRHRLTFGDATGAGIGEFVRLADHEGLKGEARIERRGFGHAVIQIPLRRLRLRHRPGHRLRLDGFNGCVACGRGACRTGADIDAADRRILGLPEIREQRAVFLVDPIAQKARGQHHRQLVAIQSGKRCLPQPVAILDFADLVLQPGPHPEPLLGQSSVPRGNGRGIRKRARRPERLGFLIVQHPSLQLHPPFRLARLTHRSNLSGRSEACVIGLVLSASRPPAEPDGYARKPVLRKLEHPAKTSPLARISRKLCCLSVS